MTDSQLTVLVASGFKELRLADQLCTVTWVGATGVQVWFNYESAIDPAAVRRCVADAGLALRSVHLPFGPGYDISSFVTRERESAVGKLVDRLDLVASLGAAFGVVHPCARVDKEMTVGTRREHLKIIADSLTRLTAAAEQRGVGLALENMPPPLLGDRIEEVIRAVTAADRPALGICFDTGHANITGRAHRMFRKAAPHVISIHVHDNGGKEDDHALPFNGTLDWDAFRAELDRADYRGEFTLECLEPILLAHRKNDLAWRDRFRQWYAGTASGTD